MSKKNCTPGDELEIPLTLVLDYSDFNATYPIGNIPAWEVTLKVVFYIIAMVLDIVGNSIIIFIIILNRKMRTTTNVLILNLAVSDLFVGIFCMWIHMGNQIDSNWPFGSFMCKFTNFSQDDTRSDRHADYCTQLLMSVTASVLTLTIISVERFIAIVYPFKAKWSALTTVIVIVCTWVAAIATASPHLFVRHLFKTLWQDREDRWCAEVWTQYYKDRDCNTWPRGKVVYYCVEGIVMYFLPIVIMIVTYSIISVKLLHRRAPGSLINSTSSAQDKSKKKVIKMLVAVLVVFTLCWTPQQTLLLMSVLGKPTTRSDIKYTAVFVAYFNSALNPILYGGFNENFRKGFSEAFKCVLVQKRNKIGI
ncbi:neuropeptide FF receptor 2, partial [Biomphalaria glabrata]